MFEHYDGPNVAYVVDRDYTLVSVSDAVRRLYPNAVIGEPCYRTMRGLSAPCAQCPVKSPSGGMSVRYNRLIRKWIGMQTAELEWPGRGTCFVVVCGLQRNIPEEMPKPGDYDAYVEINLTQNRARTHYRTAPPNPNPPEEEILDEMLARLADTRVHEEDRVDFLAFWDLETLTERLERAGGFLRRNFRERNAAGGWDIVEITLRANVYTSSEDDCIVALVKLLTLHAPDDEAPESEPLFELPILHGRDFRKLAYRYLKHLNGSPVVIAMDVEHFRLYNRWYGRRSGDRLLGAMAQYLCDFNRRFAALSGYDGGDNFFLLCRYDKEMLETLRRELSELVRAYDGFDVLFGGYVLPETDLPLQDALDCATTAMKRAPKGSAGHICWYDEKMTLAIENELRILPEIERGLRENEFTFHLQPKIAASTNAVVGAEALARWNSKKHGSISPEQFIPFAEKRGLISRLDAHIWELTLRTLHEWKQRGVTLPSLSLNVSRQDLYVPDMPERLLALVRQYGVEPEAIELEITERAFASNHKDILGALNTLRGYGFKIAIDDFGSGYSSLNMLKDIPVDTLKLDLRFLELNENNREKGISIIRSVISMARSMNVQVIVEGVETEEQLVALRELGCDLFQGYYYFTPLTVEGFEALLGGQGKG